MRDPWASKLRTANSPHTTTSSLLAIFPLRSAGQRMADLLAILRVQRTADHAAYVVPLLCLPGSADCKVIQSRYGRLGNTVGHCGTGGTSGCTFSKRQTGPTASRSDGRCGSIFAGAICDPNGPYGGCCSQYGYCGSTPDQ